MSNSSLSIISIACISIFNIICDILIDLKVYGLYKHVYGHMSRINGSERKATFHYENAITVNILPNQE